VLSKAGRALQNVGVRELAGAYVPSQALTQALVAENIAKITSHCLTSLPIKFAYSLLLYQFFMGLSREGGGFSRLGRLFVKKIRE
jgi:hypothetical protein